MWGRFLCDFKTCYGLSSPIYGALMEDLSTRSMEDHRDPKTIQDNLSSTFCKTSKVS